MTTKKIIENPEKYARRVVDAIFLHQQHIEITEKLNEVKGEFREFAAGEGTTFPAPGFGSVEVSKPSEGGRVTKGLAFNKDKFYELSPALQQKLKELGVVSDTTTVSKPGTAAVKININQ